MKCFDIIKRKSLTKRLLLSQINKMRLMIIKIYFLIKYQHKPNNNKMTQTTIL
jgi:hypothetical protein